MDCNPFVSILTASVNGLNFFHYYPGTIYVPKYHENEITLWEVEADCHIPGDLYVICDRCAITVEGYSGVCLNGQYQLLCFKPRYLGMQNQFYLISFATH